MFQPGLKWLTSRGAIFLLIILGIIVYFNALFNDFVWDDYSQIVNNPLVHSIANIPSLFSGSTFYFEGSIQGIYYKPLLSLAYTLIYTIFGNQAFAFHLGQIALHIVNSIIILLILKRFISLPLSIFGSVLFLVHPINTEAVAYISPVQEPLFFFFGSLALLLTLKLALNRWYHYFYIAILLFSSLLSKETGLLFLVLVGINTWLFRKKSLLSILITLFSTFFIYLILRSQAIGLETTNFSTPVAPPIMRAGVVERLLTLPKIIYTYLKTFFLPTDLFISHHWVVKTINFSDFLLPLIFIFIAAIAFSYFAWFLHLNNKKLLKPYLFFLFWVVIGLGFHSNILIPLDFTYADRWFYFPEVGLIGILLLVIQQISQKWSVSRTLLFLISILILSLLSARTIVRNTNWKDKITLYEHDIKLNSNSFDLQNSLGTELAALGRFDEALPHLERSVQLAPYFWQNWNNLAGIYDRRGEPQKARSAIVQALDNNKYYYPAHRNMIKILFVKEKDYEATAKFIDESLIIFPKKSELWMYKALSEYQNNNRDEALKAASMYYKLDPNDQSEALYSAIKQGKKVQF